MWALPEDRTRTSTHVCSTCDNDGYVIAGTDVDITFVHACDCGLLESDNDAANLLASRMGGEVVEATPTGHLTAQKAVRTAAVVAVDVSSYADLVEASISLRSVIADAKAALESDVLNDGQMASFHGLKAQAEKELARVDANIATAQMAQEFESGPSVDHGDFGPDDGSAEYLAAMAVRHEAESYDWEKFVSLGSQWWTADQPDPVLGDRAYLLASAREHATERVAVVTDAGYRDNLVERFVANVDKFAQTVTIDNPDRVDIDGADHVTIDNGSEEDAFLPVDDFGDDFGGEIDALEGDVVDTYVADTETVEEFPEFDELEFS